MRAACDDNLTNTKKQGTELSDTALCGVITESYGQRCAPNSYRLRGRVPMPHAWGIRTPVTGTSHPAWADPMLNASSQQLLIADYLAFDVHPARKLYAYCSGNAIFTYDYEGLQRGVFIDFAYIPEHCSDIRFTSQGNYLMATSRNSSRVFRCDPMCASSTAVFAYSSATKKYACSPASGTSKRWGDGLRVYCPAWMNSSFNAYETVLASEGRAFAGGLQNFGSSSAAENLVYTAGSFRSVSEPSSWLWWIYADAAPNRATVHTFPSGVQIVGPPAYNERVRRVFVPAHDHADKTKRLVIYQIALTSTGAKDSSKLTSGAGTLYTQLFADSIVSSALKAAGAVPSIPGFAVRLDTGALSIVDEQEARIHVLLCSSYEQLAAGAPCTASAALLSTSYGSARYKDVEFVGRVPFASSVTDPLTTPSKLFLTTLEDANAARAEMYVQCAKCQGGGITDAETEALSESDCFCEPGFMIVTSPRRRCEQCQCKNGQYLNLQQGGGCFTGRELSMPGCLPCSATCESGQYMTGSCDGSQTQNAMACLPCTLAAAKKCPAASTLPVKIGYQTYIQSASLFRSDCTDRRGMDCMRRQALLYPFDGNDLLEDLAPFARRLVPYSASGRSDGPSLEVFALAPTDDALLSTVLTSSFHKRTAAARFNATNHEYYAIPPMANVFDPSLAVRVIPGSKSLQGDARRIQSTIVWEQVFCPLFIA